MAESAHVLADNVRAKRAAIDNDLELLRQRLKQADPRTFDVRRWSSRAAPVVAGAAAVWAMSRRRRAVKSLQHLLVQGLSDAYRGEQQLVDALERMSEQADNVELSRALRLHREESEVHIDRLDRVFRAVGARPARGRSRVISAILMDGERSIGPKVRPDLRDAWLIATAQRIEHVEIATYGTLRTYAATLGYIYAAQLLQQTLEEERATDEKLTHLAERFVNPQSIRAATPA